MNTLIDHLGGHVIEDILLGLISVQLTIIIALLAGNHQIGRHRE